MIWALGEVLKIDLQTNFRTFAKTLDKFEDTVHKAQSIALEKTVQFGGRTLAKDAVKHLDDPIPAAFTPRRKSRNRLGWIWFEWDERIDIKKKKGVGGAFVQIQGQGPAQARRDQQEAIHRQIFGTTERQGTTPRTPFIIRPNELLRRQGSIRGVPLKIDKFGNLKNYRKTLNEMLAQRDKFFQVMIGESGRGHLDNGRTLPPGLYMRVLRVRTYKRNRHTKRPGGPYGGTGKKKYTKNIITILRYERIQTYKGKWEFKKKTRDAMHRRYEREFLVQLTRQIRKLKTKSVPPSVARQDTGSLI